MTPIDMDKIQSFQREFVRARDWEKFHSPKNLAMALAGEAGELLEIFQWLSEQESRDLMKDEKRARMVRHEIADIFYYLSRLTDLLLVDLEAAFWEKAKVNEERYPADRVKGTARKYTEL